MSISATVLELLRKSRRGADSAPPPSGARVKEIVSVFFVYCFVGLFSDFRCRLRIAI